MASGSLTISINQMEKFLTIPKTLKNEFQQKFDELSPKIKHLQRHNYANFSKLLIISTIAAIITIAALSLIFCGHAPYNFNSLSRINLCGYALLTMGVVGLAICAVKWILMKKNYNKELAQTLESFESELLPLEEKAIQLQLRDNETLTVKIKSKPLILKTYTNKTVHPFLYEWKKDADMDNFPAHFRRWVNQDENKILENMKIVTLREFKMFGELRQNHTLTLGDFYEKIKKEIRQF